MPEKDGAQSSMLPSDSVSKPDSAVVFSQPIQQILTMLLVIGLCGLGGWLIHLKVAEVFLANLWLNGVIVIVFFLGVITCFWHVVVLARSVSWIEAFANGSAGYPDRPPPSLLAPLATLLRGREGHTQISDSSARSILESVTSRGDEARDITRYLTNLLVFLGLLGTFYGLATTVPAVVDTIRSLGVDEGQDGAATFKKLILGLESQLGGMGTAFSSSLLGLAGSLIVGLLELFVGHGQSRFHRELEEWLSSITRLGYANAVDGDRSVAGVAAAALEQIARHMQNFQAVLSDVERSHADSRVQLDVLVNVARNLSEWLSADTRATNDQTAAFKELSESQEKLIAIMGAVEDGFASDVEARMRLRSIDVQLLRVLEEMSVGRRETLSEIHGDIASLTLAVKEVAARNVAAPVR